MWNKSKSILLSKICIIIFSALGAVLCVALPWIAHWIIDYSNWLLGEKYFHLLITGYALAISAFMVLYELYRLLRNISDGYVFESENVSHLRSISWLCIAAGGICLISAVIYYPMISIIGAMAGFMGLIIRILKNVLAEAVRLKEENDFTI